MDYISEALGEPSRPRADAASRRDPFRPALPARAPATGPSATVAHRKIAMLIWAMNEVLVEGGMPTLRAPSYETVRRALHVTDRRDRNRGLDRMRARF